MRRYLRAAIIIGVALLAIATTTSPAWRLPARADTPDRVLAAIALSPTTRVATVPAAQPPSTRTPAPAPQPPATAPPQHVAPASAIGQTIDRYLNNLVDAGLFQGAVLVARDRQILIDQGYGFADSARRIPNTPRTRFQLASMTKQFTAMAIMLLRAHGQLRLDDAICRYLADCPPTWRAITIEHLLTHTSGLPNYTDLATFDANQMHPATPDELVARFRNLPLLFPPGSGYMYENSDYVLLGLIIERITGRSYAEVLHDTIFAPLHMNDTGADQRSGAGADWAVGYRIMNEPAPLVEPSNLFAAGELYSTSQDLYRWDQALYTNQLLPQSQLLEMWTPVAGDYGYGWTINAVVGHRKIGHTGLMDGFASAIARYPDDHVTVIVLCNMSGADVEGISDYIATLVFDSA